MHNKYRRWTVVVGVLVVLSLLFSMLPLGSALSLSPQAATVVIDNATVGLTGPADSKPFSVILHINGVPATKLAGYDFAMTFNPLAMQIGTITGLNATFGAPFVSDVNNTTGTIVLVDFDAVGIAAGNYDMLLINGTAISDVAGVFPIHFTKSDIVDANGDDIVDTQTDGQITIKLPPVANYTYAYADANSTGTLDAGEQIQFTDTSTGGPTSWNYDFGDTTTSTLQNPFKLYTVAGTFTVTFTATNGAGSSTITQTIMVEPNSLATVTLSPANPALAINTQQQFAATGKDQYGNTITGGIVAAANAWTWTADANLGNISNTGLLTVGNNMGTFTNGVCAKGKYKGATKQGCTNVTIASLMAHTGLGVGVAADGVVVAGAIVEDIVDGVTGEKVVLPGGIGAYLAAAGYNGQLINILGVRGGDPPFVSTPTQSINNQAGSTTFGDFQTAEQPQPPITVANIIVRLKGTVLESGNLALSFTQIVSGEGMLVPEAAAVTLPVRRGDAKADGAINMADALFIAQYLAGLRQIGSDPATQVNPVNAASLKFDGDGDKVTIADALFLVQYLVGLRNPDMTPKAFGSPPPR